MPDACDDTCPVCGGDPDDFASLVERIEDACDGCPEGEVVDALCLVLGGILAAEPAETRPRMRRQVGKTLTSATKFHVIANCDA